MPITSEDDLLNRSELGRMLGMSNDQLKRLEVQGEIVAIRLGHHTVRYRRSEIDEFLDRHYVEVA